MKNRKKTIRVFLFEGVFFWGGGGEYLVPGSMCAPAFFNKHQKKD